MSGRRERSGSGTSSNGPAHSGGPDSAGTTGYARTAGIGSTNAYVRCTIDVALVGRLIAVGRVTCASPHNGSSLAGPSIGRSGRVASWSDGDAAPGIPRARAQPVTPSRAAAAPRWANGSHAAYPLP